MSLGLLHSKNNNLKPIHHGTMSKKKKDWRTEKGKRWFCSVIISCLWLVSQLQSLLAYLSVYEPNVRATDLRCSGHSKGLKRLASAINVRQLGATRIDAGGCFSWILTWYPTRVSIHAARKWHFSSATDSFFQAVYKQITC